MQLEAMEGGGCDGVAKRVDRQVAEKREASSLITQSRVYHHLHQGKM
jgi:hypothetical protein